MFDAQPYNKLSAKFQGYPITPAGLDLLNKLLTYDPEKRITAEQVRLLARQVSKSDAGFMHTNVDSNSAALLTTGTATSVFPGGATAQGSLAVPDLAQQSRRRRTVRAFFLDPGGPGGPLHQLG